MFGNRIIDRFDVEVGDLLFEILVITHIAAGKEVCREESSKCTVPRAAQLLAL